MDELGDMTRWQVRRREERLRERAVNIKEQFAVDDGRGLPFVSRETGVDLRGELELWRRWAGLASEMNRSGAEFVSDLGPGRVEHWRAELDPKRVQPTEPLRAYRPVAPLVRHVKVPPKPRPPRRSR